MPTTKTEFAKMQTSIVFLALCVCSVALFGGMTAKSESASQKRSPVGTAALDQDKKQRRRSSKIQFTLVLYLSARDFNQSEYERQEDLGGAWQLKRIMPTLTGNQLFYGEVCISYPTNRKIAEDDFQDPEKGDPDLFTQSAVYRLQPYEGVDEFKKHLGSLLPGVSKVSVRRPLVFVHGWRTDAARALVTTAHLKNDLERGVAIAFMWPSDPGRQNVVQSKQSYDQAKEFEQDTFEYLPVAVRAATSSPELEPDILVHSLGAKLFFDAYNVLSNIDDMRVSMTDAPLHSAIMVAPDVSIIDFAGRAKSWGFDVDYIHIYCAVDDKVLPWSEIDNKGVRRLGYCPNKAPRYRRIGVTQVSGYMSDPMRHSYFSTSPGMITDMQGQFDHLHPCASDDGCPPEELELPAPFPPHR